MIHNTLLEFFFLKTLMYTSIKHNGLCIQALSTMVNVYKHSHEIQKQTLYLIVKLREHNECLLKESVQYFLTPINDPINLQSKYSTYNEI